MKVTKRKVNDVNFCFTCGKTLDTEEYILNFGAPGATFELCRNCLKKLNVKMERVLSEK